MRLEVDQSGKIEQTNLDTIIALSNDIQYSLVLKKRIKRLLQELFRIQGKPRLFIYKTFAALIAILLKASNPSKKVIIDMEYFSQQIILQRQITEYLEKNKIKAKFEFGFVGKGSSAHILAERVAHKKQKVNKAVNFEEISKLIWPIKNDRESAY